MASFTAGANRHDVKMNQPVPSANSEVAPGLFHVSGLPLGAIPATSIVAFTRARDEAWRFPFWLAYHRWLGIDHFIIIDNRSVDGTSALLSDEGDVSLLHAPGDYGGALGHFHWTKSVLKASPPERWNLLLDVDELLVPIPWCRNGIREVVENLEAQDVDVLPALMVDCYPANFPIPDEGASPVPWVRAPLFDSGPYGYWDKRKRRPHLTYRGVRERLFWPQRYWQRLLPKFIKRKFGMSKAPYIVKDPLFRQGPSRSRGDHGTAFPANRRAQQLGYILHYKFDVDFFRKVTVAVKERQYYFGSAQYDAYDTLPRKDVVLESRHSRPFTGLRSLIGARLCWGVPISDEAKKAIADSPDADQAWAEIKGFTTYAPRESGNP
jgi:hypothetical protein